MTQRGGMDAFFGVGLVSALLRAGGIGVQHPGQRQPDWARDCS